MRLQPAFGSTRWPDLPSPGNTYISGFAASSGLRLRNTAADVALLAEMDTLHSTLSGPATKKLMERAYLVFGDPRYERLAGISVSHLYNLRGSKPYQSKRRGSG